MATYARPGWRRILIDSGAQCHVCPVSFASNFSVNYNRRVLLRGAGNHVIKHHGERVVKFSVVSSDEEYRTSLIQVETRFQVADVLEPMQAGRQ